ncbi:beta-galactosidase GalB [Opitutus terrae]|uniref:Glycoside hydrolase family 2 sugar binding n=1 Tax=Opitutus terrae (strain DSM 11246 / JCM 15787 / PB90-1) TaxID=452637 RepID=B1ZRF3_OPITP|nr:beta-galactosidase GalB [Opitutus terrae]ACB74640.1 glycoside hydrolase family 2 sugar binding [Opitutus terrae PB90-1]
MKTLLAISLMACALFGPAVFAASDAPRERVSFDAGWKFIKGDTPYAGGSLDYERIKDWVLPTGDELLNQPPVRAPRRPRDPEREVKFAHVDFDDRSWRSVDLPHDWGIEAPFQQDLSGDTGKLPWFGVAWYRKTFTLPAEDAGRRIALELDGAMSYALVWCNGAFVGGWPYGYTSWRVDLTPHLKPGGSNVIAIRLDNPNWSSRWYPGGGLYRHTWLTKTAPVHVAPWGVFVTTPEVSAESALVDVAVTLANDTDARADVRVGVRLFAADPQGRAVGAPVASSEPRALRAVPGKAVKLAHTFRVAQPRRWSLRERHRYVAETTVLEGDRVIDRIETPFGIRTIAHTPNHGFLLNGERVPLRGVCNHHDLGALGSAINERALERQLEILQAMGGNAIRTSHNPPAPELLELCDRMGFLVMVEAFDCWQAGKTPDDYSRVFHDWHEKDLRAMIRRDRNHPCVIQWSIGNEIREQWEPDGWRLAAHLAGIVREEDRTRAVAAGFNAIVSGYNGFQSVVDLVGYNYKPAEYAKLRATHPQIVQQGAETASTISSRGEYFFPVSEDKAQGRADFQVSSYDLYTPPWATTPDTEWKAQDENPFVLGEFVWTGFDYLGEPTPYNADVTNLLNFSDAAGRAKMQQELDALGKIRVPSRSSYFGIIDLAGFPKDRFYLYQARWRPELPMAHILPHWNWPERVGQVTPVFVYSSGDEAELFLNGKSLGRQKRGPGEYRFRWNDVVYQPGELKVVTYKNGKPWADAVQRTTGAAAKLLAQPDRAALRADGRDLSFVTITVADRDGLLVPRSKNKLTFSITGPATIAAVDNGDATSFEPFQARERSAYNGLALVILRTKPGESGPITLRAESTGLAPIEVTLKSE